MCLFSILFVCLSVRMLLCFQMTPEEVSTPYFRTCYNKHKICALMCHLNKGKQRLTKVIKGKQSQGLMKGMKSLKTFESWKKIMIV